MRQIIFRILQFYIIMDVDFKLATAVAVIYFLFKFLEMRFVIKENKPIKVLLQDTFLSFISVVVGQFIIGQLAPLTDGMKGGGTNAFTNDPNF